MLTLWAGQAESLWDDALPVEVGELPEDLAALDRLLSDPELLAPIVAQWRREVEQTQRAAVLTDGRPTIVLAALRRRSKLARWLRGSVADLVGERLPCNVLIIRPG